MLADLGTLLQECLLTAAKQQTHAAKKAARNINSNRFKEVKGSNNNNREEVNNLERDSNITLINQNKSRDKSKDLDIICLK